MKLPAFQFYPGDWRKDPGVQSLDYQCRGVWLEILCMMHESERRGLLLLNGKAMSDDALARLLGLDVVLLKQILTTLDNHGVTSRDVETGALMSRRMVKDENLRKIRADAGKQGGNPALLKQNPTTQLKQIPTPSSSSSVSSSSSEDKAKRVVFVPPTATEVSEYSASVGYPLDGEAWCDSYAQKGWMVGKSKMKDWKAAVRNWKRSGWTTSRKPAQPQSQFAGAF